MAHRLINLGLYRNERSLPIAPAAPCEVVNLGVYTIGKYTPPNFTASQTCAMGEKENTPNFTGEIEIGLNSPLRKDIVNILYDLTINGFIVHKTYLLTELSLNSQTGLKYGT